MKILMIGLGSIGHRHLRTIRRIYGQEVEIIAYRVRGLQRTFSDTMQIRENVLLEEEFAITSFADLDAALEQRPDIAFITNITSQHIECALKALRAGCDIFLEKPISNSTEGIRELYDEAKEKNKIVFVGFQNRYHKCLLKLREYLSQNVLGNIVSVDVEMGERLTTMHSYEDYSTTYMSREKMGGGVILNQQIHELDYIHWLFGKPVSVTSKSGKNSNLDIDVEDYASSIYIVKELAHEFPIYAHADFFQYPPVRQCKVVGELGKIEVDLIKNTVIYYSELEVFTDSYEDFSRNEMFITELKEFIESVEQRKSPAISLEDGIISMQMALAAKKANEENRTIRLEEITW